MNKVNILVASALLLVAAAAQAAEVVGKVGYMSGSLVAKRADGTIKIMGTKADVLAGDVLGTAKDSYAQIQMNDGAKMTLRPNSNLKIVEYRFNRQEPQSDSAVFDLVRGGLRSMTGLIGKRGNPDAYKMQTKVATVGIRGTDFSTRLCATPNCQDDAAVSAQAAGNPQVMPPQQVAGAAPAAPQAAPPGLYVTVHSGQVIVAQPAGNTLNLGRGETGFANQAALVRLPAPPAFMNADTKQTNAIEAKAAKAEEKAANKADDGKAAGKQDKEKADSKPDEEKKDGKADKEKDGAKPDEEKKDGKSDKEKDGAKSDKEKDGAKSDKEKDAAKPDGEKADSKPESEKAGGKPDEGKADSKPDGGNAAAPQDGGNAPGGTDGANDTINPDAGNAASTDPTVNKSGCVVQ